MTDTTRRTFLALSSAAVLAGTMNPIQAPGAETGIKASGPMRLRP